MKPYTCPNPQPQTRPYTLAPKSLKPPNYSRKALNPESLPQPMDPQSTPSSQSCTRSRSLARRRGLVTGWVSGLDSAAASLFTHAPNPKPLTLLALNPKPLNPLNPPKPPKPLKPQSPKDPLGPEQEKLERQRTLAGSTRGPNRSGPDRPRDLRHATRGRERCFHFNFCFLAVVYVNILYHFSSLLLFN